MRSKKTQATGPSTKKRVSSTDVGVTKTASTPELTTSAQKPMIEHVQTREDVPNVLLGITGFWLPDTSVFQLIYALSICNSVDHWRQKCWLSPTILVIKKYRMKPGRDAERFRPFQQCTRLPSWYSYSLSVPWKPWIFSFNRKTEHRKSFRASSVIGIRNYYTGYHSSYRNSCSDGGHLHGS